MHERAKVLDTRDFLVRNQSVANFSATCNPFPNKPWFLLVSKNKSFENTVGKGEIARNEQFLLFPQCFLPFRKTYYYCNQIQNRRLQTLLVWKSLKFVVWERVNGRYSGKTHNHSPPFFPDHGYVEKQPVTWGKYC